jgi:transposase
MERKGYPSDVSDDEWAFVAPYTAPPTRRVVPLSGGWAVGACLTLMSEAAPQREHNLREVFNALRWLVRAGAGSRFLPHDLPPWGVVYPHSPQELGEWGKCQQTQRWLTAGVFEAMAADLRALLRLAVGRKPQPSAAILDSRTLQSSPESRLQTTERAPTATPLLCRCSSTTPSHHPHTALAPNCNSTRMGI